MNQQKLVKQRLTPDANRMLHIKVPAYLGNQVDVLITPTNPNGADASPPFQRTMFWDTAFARDVLNRPFLDEETGLVDNTLLTHLGTPVAARCRTNKSVGACQLRLRRQPDPMRCHASFLMHRARRSTMFDYVSARPDPHHTKAKSFDCV